MHFDWQTEDDRPPEWSPQEEARTVRGRKWAWALLACLLLALASYGLWRRTQGGVAAVEQSAADSVRAVHDLAQRAAVQNDGELLLSLLSGQDPAWTATQQKRLRRGLLFAQSARSFGMRPTDPPVDDVTLDSKLLEASLVTNQAYVVTRTTGITERVVLRQTHLYRKGERRWLLSPPAEDFWGETHTVNKTRLTVTFPDRDGEIAIRLAGDIDAKVGEICTRLPALDCPDGFAMTVHLSADPASFLALERTPSPDTEITLPTPSLVGLPGDEKAYQALFHGYAARVAAAGITALVGYECCQRVLFFQAALDWQLYHLGLKPRPLTASRYLAAIDSLAGPAWFQMLWYREVLAQRPLAERALALAAVEILAEEGSGGTPAVLLQRTLPGAALPNDWLQIVSNHRSLAEFYQALQVHLMTRANKLQEFPPFPDQELLLTCYADGEPKLYHFTPATEQLSEARAGMGDTSRASPFPGDGATLLSPLRREEPSLFRQRSDVALTPRRPDRRYVFRPDIFSQLYSTLDAQGRFIAMQLMAYGPQLAFVPAMGEQCDGPCPEWQAAGANSVWSPDGQSILWQQDGYVWRGDPAGGRPLGRGSFPFWIDDTIYGYLSGEQVIIASVAEDVPQPLFTVEELLDVVRPSAAATDRGRLTAIQADPGGSGALVFFLTLGPGQNYLLLLQQTAGRPSWLDRGPRPGDLSVLFATRAGIDAPPGSSFSPDGKWFIATTGFSGVGPPGRAVFNLREGRLVTFAPGRYRVNYDWTPDDAWLAWPRQNYVELLSPAHGAARYFVSAPADWTPWQWCESVAWVNPQPLP